MKVLLVKCHKKTIYSWIEPIVTEPLELEYLSALLEELQIQHRVYDPLLEKSDFEGVFLAYEPDLLLLSGYITAVDRIIDYSKYAKRKNADIKVVVGGVHAEINYRDFFVDTIDVIVHSNGIKTLESLLKTSFAINKLRKVEGIAFRELNQWRVNNKVNSCLENLPLPDRSYFEKYKMNTKYLNYSPVAIVKTALSCPFHCNFCYCRLLNGGSYGTRTIDSVVEEIQRIGAEYVWIVDDSFLIDRGRVLEFIDKVKRERVHKKFIAYSRVDFIAKNEDIIEKLKDIGFLELIVGMEAVEDEKLNNFNKSASAEENRRTVKILKKNDIRLTALFIVGIEFTIKDFKKMRRWIREMKLESYTVSIYTPIKGTEHYRAYESKIQTQDWGKWDFLHLVLEPHHMSKALFYFQFYLIYMEQFFRSKYIRDYILGSLKNRIGFGGDNG